MLDLCDTAPAKKRGRKQFITPKLAASLDNAKVSDGMSIHILVSAAEALEQNVNELVINRTSLRRQRKAYREQESLIIQADFLDNVIQNSL